MQNKLGLRIRGDIQHVSRGKWDMYILVCGCSPQQGCPESEEPVGIQWRDHSECPDNSWPTQTTIHNQRIIKANL